MDESLPPALQSHRSSEIHSGDENTFQIGRCMLAYPCVQFGRMHVRTQVRMGNLTRRRQMARVNDLEALVLKVCDSFLDHVVGKPGRMKQCEPSHCQRTKSC